MTASVAQHSSTRPAFSFARYAIVVGIAAALNVGLFAIGSAAGGGMTVTLASNQDVSWPIVVIATAAPLLIAGTIVWLIARRWPVVLPWARWVGLIVAAGSIAAPLSAANDVPTAVSMAAMHLIAGAAWFAGTRPQRGSAN